MPAVVFGLAAHEAIAPRGFHRASTYGATAELELAAPQNRLKLILFLSSKADLVLVSSPRAGFKLTGFCCRIASVQSNIVLAVMLETAPALYGLVPLRA